MKELKNIKTGSTIQTDKARDDQVRNNAGGFVFEVTPKTRLERFLILGVDGGTYYVTGKDLAKQNYDFLKAMAAGDTKLLVDTVVDVSVNNRAPKNSPAIFALAVALNHAPENAKGYVRTAVPKVCRTSTHLFEFAQYVENLGGWGRSKRNAVADWYQSKTPDEFAYQAVKYRQRDGWTHRDLLRLSHPTGLNKGVVDFVLGKDADEVPRVIEGFRKAQAATTVTDVTAIVTEYKLPWEAIPTQYLRDADLWKAMVTNRTVGHTAIIRNISRMGEIGCFTDRDFTKRVAKILSDKEEITKGRLHPVAFLNARGMYGNRGGDNLILGALEDGFYNSFQNVEPSNARTLLALDVSGSMTWGAPAGLVGLNYMEAGAAMATVLLRTEPDVQVKAFADTLQSINLTKNSTFADAWNALNYLSFGRTDCALPMLWATKEKAQIDHFIVITDNETWSGRVHPFQALKQYRNASGINARLTVVGMAGTPFTIADPTDAGMLDVVGFDTAAPKVIADFARV